jgi:hypothetical protein
VTNEQQRPPAGIFKYLNPFMRFLLHSPFNGIFSGRLMLLSYTGGKTGQRYTTPVGFFMWSDDTVLAFSRSHWPLYVRDGEEVRLFVHGIWYDAEPSLVETAEERAQILDEFIQRYGLGAARHLPIGLPRDRQPTEKDLQASAVRIRIVLFRLLY